MRARSDRLAGITNGVDYDVWNPEIDPHIAKHFSAKTFPGNAHARSTPAKSLWSSRRT
jgi:starch synthase